MQALRRLLPELVPVPDVFFVLRRDGDLLILDELEDPLVLLVVRLVLLHTDLRSRVDQIVHQLIVQRASLQKLPHDLLREWLQRLPLRFRRNAEASRDLRKQEVFRPPGVLRRLLSHQIPIPPVLRRPSDVCFLRVEPLRQWDHVPRIIIHDRVGGFDSPCFCIIYRNNSSCFSKPIGVFDIFKNNSVVPQRRRFLRNLPRPYRLLSFIVSRILDVFQKAFRVFQVIPVFSLCVNYKRVIQAQFYMIYARICATVIVFCPWSRCFPLCNFFYLPLYMVPLIVILLCVLSCRFLICSKKHSSTHSRVRIERVKLCEAKVRCPVVRIHRVPGHRRGGVNHPLHRLHVPALDRFQIPPVFLRRLRTG